MWNVSFSVPPNQIHEQQTTSSNTMTFPQFHQEKKNIAQQDFWEKSDEF